MFGIKKILVGITLFVLTLWMGAYEVRAAVNLSGKDLVVYVAFHDSEGKALLEAFQKETGVNFNFLRMPAGDIIDRVQTEKATPMADIILGGAAENHKILQNAGLLEAYTSHNAEQIPAYYRDKDGFWAGFYVGPVAIGINKELWDRDFAPKGLKAPESFEDLLNPAFKETIVMPDPRSSGTGYTFVASVIQVMGEDNGFEFLKKLYNQVGQFSASGFKPAQMVGEGEYLICINFLHDQLLTKERGKPLVSNVPDGAGWEIGAVSMIKNGPNREAAKAFIDFMLGKEAGLIHSSMTKRLSTRSDVPVPGNAIALEQMPINKEFSFEKAAKERQRIIAKWEKL